jgi:hypothetical protein
MSDQQTKYRRDLFEIDNARNLTRDELVATFVPTQNFFRLLSAKNHIVLGARGSGKTALAKMLSHDHLARLTGDERSERAIASQSFIGIYVPMRLEWVSALKNKPWQSEKDAEEFFQWKLNLAACLSFLLTIESCLQQYIKELGPRARAERELATQIGRAWDKPQSEHRSLKDLREYLEDAEFEYQRLRLKHHIGAGQEIQREGFSIFNADAFGPLIRGITLASRFLEFPTECSWLLCLDEAEFLTVDHHRILNSYLRSYSGKLSFKITTMPYAHYTLSTNTQVPLDVGHDFEYVYIDQDPVLQASLNDEDNEGFANRIFNKRAKASGSKYHRLNLVELLGRSVLLDDVDPSSNLNTLALVRKYGNPQTVTRAERLIERPSDFKDQISRKLRGALFLRDVLEKQRGREELDVYSGATMAIRCGDGNPRRLIRIFNSLLLKVNWAERSGRRKTLLLTAKEQTRILTAVSQSVLTRTQSEPELGPRLFTLLNAIGDFMAFHLSERLLGSDQISSIEIDHNVSDEEWTAVKRAVGLGLLYPNINANNSDEMPDRQGKFRLGYILAPYFRILPRRGKSRPLSSIIRFSEADRKHFIDEAEQASLFSDSGE